MKRHNGEVVRYGRGTTMLGEALVFVTAKGVCRLRLLGREPVPQLLSEMRKDYAGAAMLEDEVAAKKAFRQVNAWLAGKIEPRELNLDLSGTPFQLKVWKEMLKVPHGATWSYTELARRAGKPRAVRAVASACAAQSSRPVGAMPPHCAA